MHAHEFVRAIGARREAGDRNRRCIGRDDGAVLEVRAQALEDFDLHRFVFGGRLDHHVAIRQTGNIRNGADLRQSGGLVFVGDQGALDLAVHITADLGQGLVEGALIDIHQHHVTVGEGANMCDATAHLSGADDANLVQHSLDPCGPDDRILVRAAFRARR